ncbi:MAG: CDP-diacylglycerol--serine O-phosphatidyltransferase [Acidobacteriota bacterium]|nr:CDP-diacylglycerol--serine O-phosphatidyltransferase [Acidobacteriota bacterium]
MDQEENGTQRGLRFLQRRPEAPRRLRRGVYLLPSLFTLGNMFCGYACVIFALRGDFETAAPFIGYAIVLDMLDGRIARMTGAASEFGREFDSLADVISFGIAPAVLVFAWGLSPLGRLGWAAGFLYMTAAAMRLARFNIQSASVDKRYFVGLPSPAAAAVPAATVYAYPYGLSDFRATVPVLAVMVVPALLMVSTIRFRSFKTFDLQARRPYTILLVLAAALVLVTVQPRFILVGLAYTYLASAFVGLAWNRLRRRGRAERSDHAAGAPAGPAASTVHQEDRPAG